MDGSGKLRKESLDFIWSWWAPGGLLVTSNIEDWHMPPETCSEPFIEASAQKQEIIRARSKETIQARSIGRGVLRVAKWDSKAPILG